MDHLPLTTRFTGLGNFPRILLALLVVVIKLQSGRLFCDKDSVPVTKPFKRLSFDDGNEAYFAIKEVFYFNLPRTYC